MLKVSLQAFSIAIYLLRWLFGHKLSWMIIGDGPDPGRL